MVEVLEGMRQGSQTEREASILLTPLYYLGSDQFSFTLKILFNFFK